MKFRPVEEADFSAWATMRHRLWPEHDTAELTREARGFADMDPPCTAFVAEATGGLIGFIEVSVRSYVDGAPDGVAAFVEAVWVEPEYRRQGIARALLARAEDWARTKGFAHLGSDATIDNEASHAWHRAAGFEEIERQVVFGKSIR